MKNQLIYLIALSVILLTSCSVPDINNNNKDKNNKDDETVSSEADNKTESNAETADNEGTIISDISENESAVTAVSEETKSSSGYAFDLTEDYVELDGKFYYCYINKPILFDNKEISYKDFLSYESPYDKYITLFYDDHSGSFSVADTAAFAIRYACENDIEYLDFPIEYDTFTLTEAWEYARMTFPNLPLETLNSQFEISDDGYYRIHFSKVLRDVAGSPETLKTAEEIVTKMPSTCKTQSEKAYYLYDWVCQNVIYDSYHISGKEGIVNAAPQAAYGALVDKRAVCDGIAGAVQLLYSVAGIECGKVDAFDYEGGAGHVWNVAEIDGEIWDFDATWDIYRYYEGKDDKITEEKSPGYYEWFGVERTAKTVQLDINDMMSEFGIFTEQSYSENSPVLLSYDIVVSTDPYTYEDTIYVNGKKVKDMDYSYIIKKTEQGKLVAIKFNDSLALADYWSDFTDSGSDIIDYKDYMGYPDTELLSILIYPADYFDE